MKTETERGEHQEHQADRHDSITHADLLGRMDAIARELRTEMRWLFGIGVALIALFIVIATFVR